MEIEHEIRNILHALMEMHGIKEVAELSRLSGVPHTTLHRLYVGSTPDPRVSTLIPLADHFNKSIDQLIGREPLNDVGFKDRIALLPIIPWEQVSRAKDFIQEISLKTWPHCETVIKEKADSSLFVLEIQQRTMGGIFSHKVKLIIDPDLKAIDGDYIIVHNAENNSIALKQLVIEGNDQWLKSPTEEIQAILMNKTHRICGVVVKAHVPLTLSRE